MLKVFLVEDEIVMREGIKKNIQWEKEGFEFVGDASDGELAYPLIQKTKPDILITDIRMPFMDGLELSRLVKQELPDIKIMILSGYDEFEYAKEAIKIGITDYLVKINQTTLPIEDLKSLGALFHVVNDIERIGDHAENVADAAKRRKEEDIPISKEAQRELGEMLDMVNKIIQYSVDMFIKSDEAHMQEILVLEDKVDAKEKELQRAHVERLTRGECTPDAGMIFSDVVSGLERVADHATNIAFAITAEEKDEEKAPE